MAKYAQTVHKADGTSETRIYTDYTQTAVDGAANVAGNLLGILLNAALGAVFRTKMTFGIVLAIIGFFTLFASAGWGFFLLVCGFAFVVWGYLQQSRIRAEAEDREIAEMHRQYDAEVQAQRLAQKQSIPPTDPQVALAAGEKELTRFWTKEGGKALLTNQRLIVDQPAGAVSIVRLSEVKNVNAMSQDQYNATIHIPTATFPSQAINFSSAAESRRVLAVLRTALLGTA